MHISSFCHGNANSNIANDSIRTSMFFPTFSRVFNEATTQSNTFNKLTNMNNNNNDNIVEKDASCCYSTDPFFAFNKDDCLFESQKTISHVLNNKPQQLVEIRNDKNQNPSSGDENSPLTSGVWSINQQQQSEFCKGNQTFIDPSSPSTPLLLNTNKPLQSSPAFKQANLPKPRQGCHSTESIMLPSLARPNSHDTNNVFNNNNDNNNNNNNAFCSAPSIVETSSTKLNLDSNIANYNRDVSRTESTLYNGTRNSNGYELTKHFNADGDGVYSPENVWELLSVGSDQWDLNANYRNANLVRDNSVVPTFCAGYYILQQGCNNEIKDCLDKNCNSNKDKTPDDSLLLSNSLGSTQSSSFFHHNNFNSQCSSLTSDVAATTVPQTPATTDIFFNSPTQNTTCFNSEPQQQQSEFDVLLHRDLSCLWDINDRGHDNENNMFLDHVVQFLTAATETPTTTLTQNTNSPITTTLYEMKNKEGSMLKNKNQDLSLQDDTNHDHVFASSLPLSSGVGGRHFAAPVVLVHPDEFRNPSSFLKVYGDPLCGRTSGTGATVTTGRHGNWTCISCGNVNYPRRFRCNKCNEIRNAQGDEIVNEYVLLVYQQHLKAYKRLSSSFRQTSSKKSYNPSNIGGGGGGGKHHINHKSSFSIGIPTCGKETKKILSTSSRIKNDSAVFN